jgi:hypothetical protein
MLTEAELDRLALQVDEQLRSLDASIATGGLKGVSGEGGPPDALAQRRLIERLTGEGFEGFWERYRRHLWRDLCLPGGMLYEQWRKYRDVESKSAVRVSYAWLAAMGIPTASVAPAAVALAVFLLNVLIKIGIDALCEGCAEEPKPV